MNNSIDDQKTTELKRWISKLTAQKYGFIKDLANHSLMTLDEIDSLISELVAERMNLSHQYFEFATDIQPDSSLLCRQIISRCYYSMHHAARAVIFATRRGDLTSHEKVIKAIGKLFGSDMADLLLEQLNVRNTVEYELFAPDDIRELAKKSVNKAREFIKKCDLYIKERR